MTHEEKIEKACNKFIEEGNYPTKCSMHPATLADLRAECVSQQRSRLRMTTDGEDTRVLLTEDKAMVAAVIEFIEDETVPVGEYYIS